VEQRRISAAQVDRWLSLEQQSGARPGYLARLREGGLTNNELLEVAALYRRTLLDQEVAWQSGTAYFIGQEESA